MCNYSIRLFQVFALETATSTVELWKDVSHVVS